MALAKGPSWLLGQMCFSKRPSVSNKVPGQAVWPWLYGKKKKAKEALYSLL
jgi:hypothetical protein